MRKRVFRYTKDDYVFVYRMLCLRSEGATYPEIGKMFNKDHSTVIHWCKKFKVDIGIPVVSYDDFICLVNNKPTPNKYKYQDILEEHINLGKASYKDYLDESKRNMLY